jgi:hypothetical protein
MGTVYTDRAGLNAPDGMDPIRNGDNQFRALAARIDEGIAWGGRCFVDTEQSTTSTTHTTLTTPDRVQNVVLPTDGLLFFAYQALVKRATQVGEAAVYIGSNQLALAGVNASPGGQATAITAATWQPISSYPGGLTYHGSSGSVDAGADVTTGQAVGGFNAEKLGGVCAVFAAAGTYDVSVRFSVVSGGTIYAKNRKLWVWTQGFPGFPEVS